MSGPPLLLPCELQRPVCQALSPVQVYFPDVAPSCKRHISEKQGMASVIRGIPQVEPYKNDKHVIPAFGRNAVCDGEIAVAQNLLQQFSS